MINVIVTSCIESQTNLKVTILDVNTMNKGLLVYYKHNCSYFPKAPIGYHKISEDVWELATLLANRNRLPDYSTKYNKLITLLAQ